MPDMEEPIVYRLARSRTGKVLHRASADQGNPGWAICGARVEVWHDTPRRVGQKYCTDCLRRLEL